MGTINQIINISSLDIVQTF